MFGLGILAILALAMLMWAGMSLHAKITRQVPPWKRGEHPPPTPLANALWGAGAELPSAPPEQRKRSLRLLAGMLAAVVVVGGVAVWITWSVTGSSDEALAAAFIAYVGTFFVAVPIALAIEARGRGQR